MEWVADGLGASVGTKLGMGGGAGTCATARDGEITGTRNGAGARARAMAEDLVETRMVGAVPDELRKELPPTFFGAAGLAPGT